MKVTVNGKEINAKHSVTPNFIPNVIKKKKGKNKYEVQIEFETDKELSSYEMECMGRFAKAAFNNFGEEGK